MFKNLQQKWNVSAGRVILILITFALGGSLTGYLGKKIMAFSGIVNPVFYIPVYIIIVTLVWPFMVLLMSVPFGQTRFFIAYLKKMFWRLKGKKTVGSKKNVEVNKSFFAVGNKQSMVNLAIFASGAGSNAQQIITHFKGHPSIKVALVVCNKPGAGVLSIAAAANIPALLIEREEFLNGSSYLPYLKEKNIGFLVLAGFLWKIPQALVAAFPKRIINIHPALLPAYGGKGMYGANVHTAVIQNGETQTGITIHYVDEHYDSGDIIFQAQCPVLPGDTPQTLAQRIHKLEHAHFPTVIEQTIKQMVN